MHCKFKNTFEIGKYIITIKNNDLRRHISCFRLSSHKLKIETNKISLGNTSWPTLHMFECLMSTKSTKKLLNIAKFIKDANVIGDNSLVS